MLSPILRSYPTGFSHPRSSPRPPATARIKLLNPFSSAINLYGDQVLNEPKEHDKEQND